MEDNNAIKQQFDYVEGYKKIAEAYKQLEETANQLYNRVKQLENNWMLQRADFLFRVIDSGKFNSDTIIKAEEELTNFLFPKAATEETVTKEEE